VSNNTLDIVALSGSLRAGSFNARLLEIAKDLAPKDAEIEIYDYSDVPLYNGDLDDANAPAAVQHLRERIRRADAVLIATPEYNFSVPGVLKNALDWASRPAGKSALNGKPAAVIGASTGMFGAVWAQAETRKVLGALGGRVVEAELPVAKAAELAVEDGRLELDPQLSEQLEQILSELVAAVEEAEALAV